MLYNSRMELAPAPRVMDEHGNIGNVVGYDPNTDLVLVEYPSAGDEWADPNTLRPLGQS